MSLSESLGEWQYLRMKASWYVETARAWVMPGAAAGAFVKYLEFETWQAILAALLVAPLVEGAGYLLGRFMWERGGTEREYAMSLLRDPFKRQSLERLEAIEKLLQKILDQTARAQKLGSALSDLIDAIESEGKRLGEFFQTQMPHAYKGSGPWQPLENARRALHDG